MPDLRRVLSDYDLGQLRLIASLWDVDLAARSLEEAVDSLAAHMLEPGRVAAVVGALPADARAALAAVTHRRMPLAQFARKHGEVRAMGPARRDREQPWINSPSPAETLWYRGLIARAFFNEGQGPHEFFFIPDDLRVLMPIPESPPAFTAPPGQPVSLSGPANFNPASLPAADDVTTLLAYLQVHPVKTEGGVFPAAHRLAIGAFLRRPEALDYYTVLVRESGLAAGTPLKPEPVQAGPFLEAPAPAQLGWLAEGWRDSAHWNDLLQLPDLIFEGQAWRNDPVSARAAILALLKEVPPETWWSLDSFVAALKERQPDFQRPAGDYNSWYIRDAATNEYLRGFVNWERVDGALVRWMIQHPLRWLGLVETFAAGDPPASANSADQLPAFRITPWGAAFLGLVDWPAAAPRALIEIGAEGTLRVPASASSYARFQVARVTRWLPASGPDYAYRLTPGSLAQAAAKGISVSRIIAFLEKAAGEGGLPAPLVGALRGWEREGGQAALRDAAVLKLADPALVDRLRRAPEVKPYLGESLAPGVVVVRREDLDRLRTALVEMGLLVDE